MRVFDVPKNLKIVVGLSGGVDSATAAALLCDAGWDVTGIHLRLLKETDAHLQNNEIDA
jgi:tRNA-specific 2-thiouridylase